MAMILLHSSKTMRHISESVPGAGMPQLMPLARQLAEYVKTLSPHDLAASMHISAELARTVHQLYADWPTAPTQPAIDAFIGDIYSGLRAPDLSDADRQYAHDHLLILSGLYGGLRALDSIAPYRLEMGYRLPDEPYANLYHYWSDHIAALLPPHGTIINLSAVEYTKAVLPHLPNAAVITPKFLTLSPKTGEPTFVTVHAKIARGAFARWLIQTRSKDGDSLEGFTDLGYAYDAVLSSPDQPVYICKTFGGLGLSIRRTA